VPAERCSWASIPLAHRARLLHDQEPPGGEVAVDVERYPFRSARVPPSGAAGAADAPFEVEHHVRMLAGESAPFMARETRPELTGKPVSPWRRTAVSRISSRFALGLAHLRVAIGGWRPPAPAGPGRGRPPAPAGTYIQPPAACQPERPEGRAGRPCKARASRASTVSICRNPRRVRRRRPSATVQRPSPRRAPAAAPGRQIRQATPAAVRSGRIRRSSRRARRSSRSTADSGSRPAATAAR